MELTFVTFNIKNGGIDNGDDTRLRRQMERLARLNPTVVALQECKWDLGSRRTFHVVRRILGMEGFMAPSAHHDCHLAIFVREGAGLQVVEERPECGDPWWHGVACVVVEAQGFPEPLQLASCHLAPSSPQRRLNEAESFALVAERGPIIAGGDWNALPAADPAPPGPVSGKHHRKLDRSAANALEEIGLSDVGAHVHDLTPTVARPFPYRCDRVLTSLPPQVITGHQVIQDLDAESDHRPVVATFNLAAAAGHR